MQDCTPLLIGHQRPNLGNVADCNYTRTLTAWSSALDCEVVIAVTCKQWGCRFCGEQKARKLAATAKDGKPNKLITLTVNPSLHENPRAAFETTTSCVAKLIQTIRRNHGEFEALRVLELTKAGWPHYHLVARTNFIPQRWLSNEWDRLTGARIVDIREIKQEDRVYWYVMKYLGKQRHCPWTNRRVTLTRNFAPRPPPPRSSSLELNGCVTEHMRPEDFFRWQFAGTTWIQIGTLAWAHTTQAHYESWKHAQKKHDNPTLPIQDNPVDGPRLAETSTTHQVRG